MHAGEYVAETGFYHLQSRYYAPDLCRFINADGQLNDDILGNNLFAYCGNNPVTRTDDSGQGWWIAASAIVGGLVGGVAKIVSNVSTGKSWNNGLLGAIAGGAVYGGVLAATGSVVAASFASAATESVVNQVISYTPLAKLNGSQRKNVTKGNVVNSVKTVAVETVFNGVVSTITGKIAGKIVPTNNGWFKPQKFVSSFVGRYAKKSELQSLTQGGLLVGYQCFEYSVNQSMQGQHPTVTFFSDTEIRLAG